MKAVPLRRLPGERLEGRARLPVVLPLHRVAAGGGPDSAERAPILTITITNTIIIIIIIHMIVLWSYH